jgi:gamma-D-glutamyl-L-lysine dipeptidyl-peptidase
MDRIIKCVTAISNITATPSFSGEVVSQLVYGETATVTSDEGRWWGITTVLDNYTGFVLKNTVEEMPNGFEASSLITTSFLNTLTLPNGTTMNLPIGCFVTEQEANNLQGEIISRSHHKFDALKIEAYAKRLLYVPYIWGGKSSFGIDCSGYTQLLYRLMNIDLPRDASMQINCGEVVGFLQEAQLGDLAFFDNTEGQIIHVGLLLDSQTIIHAAGCVRIDSIDAQGIVQNTTGLRTHNLRLIKRIAV